MEVGDKEYLYVMRERLILQNVFKCIKGSVPLYLANMYQLSQSNINTRCSDTIIQPKVRNTIYDSASNDGARFWNKL